MVGKYPRSDHSACEPVVARTRVRMSPDGNLTRKEPAYQERAQPALVSKVSNIIDRDQKDQQEECCQTN
jgi:hypothetical protein